MYFRIISITEFYNFIIRKNLIKFQSRPIVESATEEKNLTLVYDTSLESEYYEQHNKMFYTCVSTPI